MSLKSGFSSFAISRGRAFTLVYQNGSIPAGVECCVAVDAATGTNIWTAAIGSANMTWNPSGNGVNTGGLGAPPYNTGDGPRTTPAVEGGSVFVLSARMVLISLNWTNGAVNWTKDLVALYGASEPGGCPDCWWNNGASPLLDNGLIFVNLNSANDNNFLCAFSTTDGSRVWASPNNEANGLAHNTPVVATIQGVRQVIFATMTRLVSLDCNTGSSLWQFMYPFPRRPQSLGASPVVYSNIVFCTEQYYDGGGSTAAQITLTDGTWHVQQLYYKDDSNYWDPHYRSLWMTPVCYQGFIYMLCGGADPPFLSSPLNCIELSTGDLKWAETNGFGRGGLILVNTNLLVLTEDGQLVLVQPNPSAYTELARYRAFQFTTAVPGKCWNSPAYSNGRIYARGTTGGVCVQVAATQIGPLAQIQVAPANAAVAQYGQQQFTATALDALGTPLDPQPAFSWSVSGGGTLDANGLFTAYGVPGGSFVVMASSGGFSNSTALTITSNGLPFLPTQTNRVIHALTTLTVTNTATAGPFVSQFGTNTSPFNYADRNMLLAAGWSFYGTNGGTGRNTEYTVGAGAVDYNQTTHPGVLAIPCDEGDLSQSPNSTRNMLFRSLPSDWQSIRLTLTFAPVTTDYQQAHLGLYQDDYNYMQMGVAYNHWDGNERFTMDLEIGGTITTPAKAPTTNTNLCFRLDRSLTNSTVTCYYSFDGTNWTLLGATNAPFTSPRLMIWTGSADAAHADLAVMSLRRLDTVAGTTVPRILSYTLLDPPAGVSIDTNGIITWTPQATGTNLITTVVTDNGTPSLHVTNSFSVVVLGAVSRPVITAFAAANSVAIAWPGDLTGCQLQSTTNLGPSSLWQPVTNAPQSINGRWTVTIQPLNGRRFYRLLQP
jgi:outer membrane protein assembly factor BamB